MEVPVKFRIGSDVQNGEPRLWLYADRQQWPPSIRARLDAAPVDAVVTLGELRFACRIKAHDGDGNRTYVAAGSATNAGGAQWPGHRELTEHLRSRGLASRDEVAGSVEVAG